MKLIKIMLIMVLFCSALVAFGQNLLDNPDYKKALELQALAEKALARGDYDKAYEYSAEAAEYAKKAKEVADKEWLKYRADTLIRYLDERFAKLNTKKAETEYPDEYNQAKTKYENAKTAYTQGNYEKSVADGEAARDDLDKLDSLLVRMTPAPTPSPTPTPTTTKQVVLPRYYVVRLIPENRDCLWNIAGYPFVYNDPNKWEMLYNANKNILPVPSDPNLIYPNQIIEIPAVAGEKREGTHEPGKNYPVLP